MYFLAVVKSILKCRKCLVLSPFGSLWSAGCLHCGSFNFPHEGYWVLNLDDVNRYLVLFDDISYYF